MRTPFIDIPIAEHVMCVVLLSFGLVVLWYAIGMLMRPEDREYRSRYKAALVLVFVGAGFCTVATFVCWLTLVVRLDVYFHSAG